MIVILVLSTGASANSSTSSTSTTTGGHRDDRHGGQDSDVSGMLGAPKACVTFMRHTCSPHVLRGEPGYYLTVFESAVQYAIGCALAGRVVDLKCG